MTKATSPVTPRVVTLSEDQLKRVASSMSILSRAFTLARPHENLLKEAGVRLDRAGSALLFKLRAHGESARVSDLAELLDVDTPAVTRKIQQLERLGYVTSTPDTEDKRAKRITPDEVWHQDHRSHHDCRQPSIRSPVRGLERRRSVEFLVVARQVRSRLDQRNGE
jgi:hypothetical protein